MAGKKAIALPIGNMQPSNPTSPAVIFLLGPPGSGKTTLGRNVCSELGLRFRDGAASVPNHNRSTDDALAAIELAVTQKSVDVVAVPWTLQQATASLAKLRVLGATVVLWSHPLEMQVRAGANAATFTPRSPIKTKGGFGRLGTGCPEFRRLDRACDHVLLLAGLSLDDALANLKSLVERLRLPESEDPAERESLTNWAENWHNSHGGEARACKLLIDSMARYTLHLKEKGASPRKMSGVYSDLDAAGMLVMSYHAPKGKNVFEQFQSAPCTFEYQRKFSDSPNAIARYERTLRDFGQYLRHVGLLENE